jgi:hypothetical protein
VSASLNQTTPRRPSKEPKNVFFVSFKKFNLFVARKTTKKGPLSPTLKKKPKKSLYMFRFSFRYSYIILILNSSNLCVIFIGWLTKITCREAPASFCFLFGLNTRTLFLLLHTHTLARKNSKEDNNKKINKKVTK